MEFNLGKESVKYIKIGCKDRVGEICSFKANIGSIDENRILASVKNSSAPQIDYPQDAVISFVSDNGLYHGMTVLTGMEYKSPYTIVTLKTPTEIEYRQQREYFRVKMNESVILTYQDKAIPYKIYDISANGIRLQIDEQLRSDGNDVTLDILFSPENVKTRAKLVRRDNDDNILKASFYYVNISENDRDIIAKKCIQQQLIDKRNSQI